MDHRGLGAGGIVIRSGQSRELAAKELLLLDFDGPVCSVFAGYPAPDIAQELVAFTEGFAPDLAKQLGGETDPMQVLSTAAMTLPRQRVIELDERLRRAEVLAVETATLTSGASELINAAYGRGLSVGIVSNNSEPSITKYLKRNGLDSMVARVLGRPFAHPESMKPKPFLLEQALASFKTTAAKACFVGDSVTDIEAGKAAAIMTIGLANKAGKRQRLAAVGAEILVDELWELPWLIDAQES
ncbi:HAD family hydrolase [Glycomyces terrestris]|uniref:HAD family hydrolase n=1 Tax=Glycomyces terrestris TaxID=2493553 RepID=A0A426URK1_9ACTN|nr:HAD family hydrolase [Glycomyces terrestris]